MHDHIHVSRQTRTDSRFRTVCTCAAWHDANRFTGETISAKRISIVACAIIGSGAFAMHASATTHGNAHGIGISYAFFFGISGITDAYIRFDTSAVSANGLTDRFAFERTNVLSHLHVSVAACIIRAP